MYDHTNPCYLDHSQQGKLKASNQDLHDINHTFKHDFIDLEHLSRIHGYILIVMIFWHSPLMLILLLFLKWCHDDDI